MVSVFAWMHFFHAFASASAFAGSIWCNPDLIIDRMFLWNNLAGFRLCIAFRLGSWLIMCHRSNVAADKGLRGFMASGIHQLCV